MAAETQKPRPTGDANVLAKRRWMNVFDASDLLNNLKFLSSVDGKVLIPRTGEQAPAVLNLPTASVLTAGDNDPVTCMSCNVEFEDRADYRIHSKTAWHVFNVKQSAANLRCVSEEEFNGAGTKLDKLSLETLSVPDCVEGEDSEEIESSEEQGKGESESDDDQEEAKDVAATGAKLALVSSTATVHVWRNVIESKVQPKLEQAQALHRLLQLPFCHNWCVMMSSGGRFAGAVFNKMVPVVHKAFQRYTVRRKQGGSQASKDNQSGTSQPKSIGSSLRRHEQVRFEEELVSVLKAWKAYINSCDFIFLFAPSSNQAIFFKHLSKADPRIRKIPFPVKRPTYSECVRVHKQLTTLEIEELQVNAEPVNDTETNISTNDESKQNKANKIFETPELTQETMPCRPDHLLQAVRSNDVGALKVLYEQNSERPENSESLLHVAFTLKHFDLFPCLLKHEDPDEVELVAPFRSVISRAAQQGLLEVVSQFLSAGANPCIKDGKMQTAYTLAKTKELRNVLRKFAGKNPNKFDYDFPPLTDEMEEEAKAKQAAKKKAQRERKKLQQKQQKAEEEANRIAAEKIVKQRAQEAEEKAAGLARQAKLAQMTPKERAALALENRLKAQKGIASKCDNPDCMAPLKGIPFTRLNFQYCTTKCLRSHRESDG